MHNLCLGLLSVVKYTHHCCYNSSGDINQKSLISPLKTTSHARWCAVVVSPQFQCLTSEVSSSTYWITGVVCNGLITILSGEGGKLRGKNGIIIIKPSFFNRYNESECRICSSAAAETVIAWCCAPTNECNESCKHAPLLYCKSEAGDKMTACYHTGRKGLI